MAINIFQKVMMVTIATLIIFVILDKIDDRIQEKLEKGDKISIFDKFLLNYVNKLINLIVRAYPLVFIAIIITLYIEFTPAIKKYIGGLDGGDVSVPEVYPSVVTGGEVINVKLSQLSSVVEHLSNNLE